eukprot:4316250-Ditylum_brightwellii.AAC.1
MMMVVVSNAEKTLLSLRKSEDLLRCRNQNEYGDIRHAISAVLNRQERGRRIILCCVVFCKDCSPKPETATV